MRRLRLRTRAIGRRDNVPCARCRPRRIEPQRVAPTGKAGQTRVGLEKSIYRAPVLIERAIGSIAEPFAQLAVFTTSEGSIRPAPQAEVRFPRTAMLLSVVALGSGSADQTASPMEDRRAGCNKSQNRTQWRRRDAWKAPCPSTWRFRLGLRDPGRGIEGPRGSSCAAGPRRGGTHCPLPGCSRLANSLSPP
jgi:hypothetical protein